MQFNCSDGRCANMWSKLFISIGCIDFRIQEPFVFSHKQYFFNFNGPGVRYKIGLSLGNGGVVWKFEPFECCICNDIAFLISNLKIFLQQMSLLL